MSRKGTGTTATNSNSSSGSGSGSCTGSHNNISRHPLGVSDDMGWYRCVGSAMTGVGHAACLTERICLTWVVAV
jgi:hypothetical protein